MKEIVASANGKIISVVGCVAIAYWSTEITRCEGLNPGEVKDRIADKESNNKLKFKKIYEERPERIGGWVGCPNNRHYYLISRSKYFFSLCNVWEFDLCFLRTQIAIACQYDLEIKF